MTVKIYLHSTSPAMTDRGRRQGRHYVKHVRIRVFTDPYSPTLNRILLYNDRIYESVLIRENTCQRKRVFSHTVCSDGEIQKLEYLKNKKSFLDEIKIIFLK